MSARTGSDPLAHAVIVGVMFACTGCVGMDARYGLGSLYMLAELHSPEMEYSTVAVVEQRSDHGRAYGGSYAFMPLADRPTVSWEHTILRCDDAKTDVSYVDVTFAWPRRDVEVRAGLRWASECGLMMQSDGDGGGAVGVVAGLGLHIATGRHACVLGTKVRVWGGYEGAADGSAISFRLGYAWRY